MSKRRNKNEFVAIPIALDIPPIIRDISEFARLIDNADTEGAAILLNELQERHGPNHPCRMLYVMLTTCASAAEVPITALVKDLDHPPTCGCDKEAAMATLRLMLEAFERRDGDEASRLWSSLTGTDMGHILVDAAKLLNALWHGFEDVMAERASQAAQN